MNEILVLMKQELAVILLIFLLLFIKLGKKEWKNERLLTLLNILLALNLVSGFTGNTSGNLFGNMFRTNELLIFEKNLLNLGTLIISLQSTAWLKTHKHVPEFYLLLLSTLLGMFFMLSANNLLLFYLGLELSGIPLAALANFDLEKRRSAEAAMKFIFSSAFSSGLLLFGISLIYGLTGTLNFPDLAQQLTGSPLAIFSFLLFFSGLAFKMSVVPFHFWTADVYEGAPVAVTSYFSVISKGAVVFVLLAVLYNVFGMLSGVWYNVLFLLSVLTMLTGNLFAIRQQNLKRFLAFSSVTQAGFLLVGMSGQSPEGSTSVIYFVLIYIFSNLAAFGVISHVSAVTGKETIDDYKGFYKTNPVLSWAIAIGIFSLAGVPPTAGFFGKFFLLLAGAGKQHYLLVSIAALNIVISLYYYLRVVKAIFMDNNAEPIEKLSLPVSAKIAMFICLGGILVTGLASGAYQYIHSLMQ
jgi:NADH-quinone oxidoreductase subunit N